MRKFILLLLILLTIGQLKSMAQCKVSGNNINTGNEVVAYANVQLENIANNAKQFVITDDKGFFCIKNIAVGDYRLSISMVGIETYTTNVRISTYDVTLNFDDIKIQVSNTMLSEVFVVGQTHVCEIKPSTINYKTSSLISETGGTAGDILKNMPSVAMGGSPGHIRDIRFRGWEMPIQRYSSMAVK